MTALGLPGSWPDEGDETVVQRGGQQRGTSQRSQMVHKVSGGDGIIAAAVVPASDAVEGVKK